MQSAAFAAAELDWKYVLRDVLPEDLEAAVREVEYANVTAPYKLDAALILGSDLPSVNTIVRERGFSTDAAILEGGMKGVDVMFHVAGVYKVGIPAKERAAMFETNVTGTERVLDAAAAAGVPRIVYVSTVGVFGNTGGKIVDETHQHSEKYVS